MKLTLETLVEHAASGLKDAMLREQTQRNINRDELAKLTGISSRTLTRIQNASVPSLKVSTLIALERVGLFNLDHFSKCQRCAKIDKDYREKVEAATLKAQERYDQGQANPTSTIDEIL